MVHRVIASGPVPGPPTRLVVRYHGTEYDVLAICGELEKIRASPPSGPAIRRVLAALANGN